MAKCKQCGSRLLKKSDECPNCGAKLKIGLFEQLEEMQNSFKPKKLKYIIIYTLIISVSLLALAGVYKILSKPEIDIDDNVIVANSDVKQLSRPNFSNKEVEALVENYKKAFVHGVNRGDFSEAEKFLDPGGNYIKSQNELFKRYVSEGTKLEYIGIQFEPAVWENNRFAIKAKEQYMVTLKNGSQIKEYKWTYYISADNTILINDVSTY